MISAPEAPPGHRKCTVEQGQDTRMWSPFLAGLEFVITQLWNEVCCARCPEEPRALAWVLG